MNKDELIEKVMAIPEPVICEDEAMEEYETQALSEEEARAIISTVLDAVEAEVKELGWKYEPISRGEVLEAINKLRCP